MAARHSLTIQLAARSLGDYSPGHAAVTINTPRGQTYVGLGPASHDWKSLKGVWSSPSFAPQSVPTGAAPPNATDPYNYSTVSGHKSYATYTIPIAEDQAAKAMAEIQRIKAAGEDYLLGWRHCTTIVNQIMQAAGLETTLPYAFPGSDNEYLSNLERTLRANPKARHVIDGAGRLARIPDALREIQRDYAEAGRGYDTPSERLGGMPQGPKNDASLTKDIWQGGTAPVDVFSLDQGRTSFEDPGINRRLVRRNGYDPQTTTPNCRFLRRPLRKPGYAAGGKYPARYESSSVDTAKRRTARRGQQQADSISGPTYRWPAGTFRL